MKKQWLLEGSGAALLIVGPLFYPLLFPGNLSLYHHRFELASMIGGLFLDLLGLLILYVAVAALLSHLPELYRRIGTSCLAGFFLWCFFRTVDSLYILQFKARVGGASHFLSQKLSPGFFLSFVLQFGHKPFAIIIPALLLLIAFLKPAAAAPIVRSVLVGLASFAFCGIWMVPQLLYMGFALHPTPVIEVSTSQPLPTRRSRIVWILFDELSYNLVFDRPQEGMTFPNFQRLRSQSISFSNIEPAGIFTDRVIPSLFTGREIDKIRSSSKGTLEFFDHASRKWVSLDPRETLFGSADVNGWNPAVVGWYIPDCRNYRSVLTACSWSPRTSDDLPFEKMGMSAGKSVLANALTLPGAILSGGLERSARTTDEELHENILQYRDVMTEAGTMIQEGQVRFLFIHLPIPHPPGYFDRKTHRLCQCGNYLDNLVLSDDTLGLLLGQIEATSWARDTTLIVSSDHSWRVPMWDQSPYWTAEEQRVSQGKFDERPVFLVHFPGQDASEEISVPAPELVEHDMIDAMLSDHVENRTDFDEFLQRQLATQAFKEKP